MENSLDCKDELIKNIASTLERYSMRCRCGGLAIPQSAQGHSFQCLKCNRIHQGVNYNFLRSTPICSKTQNLSEKPFLEIACFDNAVNFLRNKYSVNDSDVANQNSLFKKFLKVIKY